MKVLITGATGLVGTALIQRLLEEGHDVVAVSRSKEKASSILPSIVEIIECDLNNSKIPKDKLKGIDSVISLIGENVSYDRWSPQQKEKILNSRVVANQNLINSIDLNELSVFIGASAIGIYKQSNASEWISEQAELNSDFLADVCKKWEKTYADVEQSCRTVILRVGVVLDQNGGMLKKLIPLYRLGLGGKIGNGKAWVSWIHIDDLVNMLIKSLNDQDIRGNYNAVAPNPCLNSELNKSLADALNRFAPFIIPKFMVKLLYGEMGTLALNSQRISTRFPMDFRFVQIGEALKNTCIYKRLPNEKKKMFHYRFQVTQFVPASIEEVFSFFKDAKNLETITPPLLNFKILYQSSDEIKEGTEFRYKLKVHGFPIFWKTIITNWKENELFTDYQAKGPYRTWFHTHKFVKVKGGVLMTDTVDYALPFGYLGDIFSRWLVKRDVTEIFNYRKKVIDKVFYE